MPIQAQVTNAAINSSVLLSYAAYTDETDPGEQASDIQAMIKSITVDANGPFKLTWGPINNMGILAFVAQGEDGSYTLALRGTVMQPGASGSWSNVFDDLDVTEQVPFPYPLESGASIAQGSMIALANLITATDPTTDTCLVDYLRNIAVTSDETLTLNVTGHSLGGDLANLASAWLADQYTKGSRNNSTLAVTPYTFAAPMTGDTNFATLWNRLFGAASYAAVNEYDIVPMAWTDAGITEILATYSGGPVLKDCKSAWYDFYYSVYIPLSVIQTSLEGQGEHPYPFAGLQPSQTFGFAGWALSSWVTSDNDNWGKVAEAEHSIGTYVLAAALNWFPNNENDQLPSSVCGAPVEWPSYLPPQNAADAAPSASEPSAREIDRRDEPTSPVTRASLLVDKEALARWRATGPGWRYRMALGIAKNPQ